MSSRLDTRVTEGVIWKQLLAFFFPILLGTFFQQIYNTSDAIIVGRFLGKEALASVGGCTASVINLLVGFFVGLSSGATVIISQFFGAKKTRDVSDAVHTAVALSVACGILITIAGVLFSPLILRKMKTPNEIIYQASLYLTIFFAGILPQIVYNMGAGILRAVGDSRRPLYFLIVSCAVNVLLDLLFVGCFRFGIAGAAWATVLSQTVSMILVCACMMRSHESYRLEIRKISVTPRLLHQMLKIGLPGGLQSSMYNISNIIIQSAINMFGTVTIAACAAESRVDAMFWMTINSFGIAITTFAGQNYGAGKIDRVKKSMWETLGMSAVAAVLISVFFYIYAPAILKMFSGDAAVVECGVSVIRFIVPTFITYICVEILSGALRGCGKTIVPMLMTCGGICVLRLVWIAAAVPLRKDILTVLASYPITWITTSVLLCAYYAVQSKRNFSSRLPLNAVSRCGM
ncbi:MAG: MATE family efflux transporter [Bacteroides sp.]|nr:MATE family efflux transporter [Prevotella sp.]MCM1408782.1 MATE family efflux transporter [Treponema brennaborense]MCM1470697.1 MATE family efflux transporter [Bacteroides sp.]